MKSNTQNKKIEAITEKTLVIGIDVGSETHYARAFDYRGIEFSKKPFKFSNSEAGFEMFKAQTLVEAARHSVGTKEGATAARIEIRMLLEDYESRNNRLQEVMFLIEELVKQIPMAEKLMEIKGVGIKTVSGFLAEVGDITRFSSPKELQKLAGLALVENSSGKHKGQTTISRRGRKRLRYLLFEVAMSLVGKNPEFGTLHHYYTTRKVNPLKKMQSLMAVATKLIRVFYAMLTKGVEYDSAKMLGDIKRPAEYM